MVVRKSKAEKIEKAQQTLNLFEGLVTSAVVDEVFDNEPVLPSLPERTSFTVTELTRLMARAWETHPVLGKSVVVEGELTNIKRSARGHIYFTLKDGTASIGGILWGSVASRLTFDLQTGMAVYLTGKLEIYANNGSYSIVASKIEPVGIGALQLAFEQIKMRLDAEGLFMEEGKRQLPAFPERIGIVTSSTGAVIHDMLRVIRRKNPEMQILIAPAKVQGEGAAQEIAEAIRELGNPHYQLDAIIVARGGGSFEDLFCFSEEIVVRAVYECDLPIVTGIGHEPDFSLADAAADYSAATPTAAADWLIPDRAALFESFGALAESLMGGMQEQLLNAEQTLDMFATRLIDAHEGLLNTTENRLYQKQERLLSQFELAFQKKEQQVATLGASLNAFNPLTTLARGYAIPTRADGHVLQSAKDTQAGERFSLRLHDGQLDCQVL